LNELNKAYRKFRDTARETPPGSHFSSAEAHGLEGNDIHRLGQCGIEQPVMPDRGVAGRVARLKCGNGAGQAIGLAELLEREDASPFGGQRGRDLRAFRKDGQQLIAKGSRLLEIVGLQKAKRALVEFTRVGRPHDLEAEERGALGRIAGDHKHGQGRDHVPARFVEQARTHAGRRTCAILTHGDLPDADCQARNLAQVFGGRLLRYSPWNPANRSNWPRKGPLRS
jgi:hypothetical protein